MPANMDSPNIPTPTRIQTLLNRILPPVYVAAILDPANVKDNPIAEREARKERRGRDLWLLLLVTGAALLGVFVLYAYVIGLLTDSRALRHGVPRYLGGSYGASLCICIAGVHVWFVLQASQRKTTAFFLDEYRRNTLHGLLCVAVTPFQLALQASVHPFRQSMLVALLGLPFYFYVMSIGGISITDLIGLYILFALFSFRPPRWRTPVFAGLKPEEIAKKGKHAAQNGPFAWAFFVLWMTGLLGRILDPVLGRNWIGSLIVPAWQLLPPHAQSIGPAFMLAWPLMIVRWMMTAEPFFGFKVPPVLFVPVLVVASRLLGAWLTGMYLRIEEAPQLGQLWDSSIFRRARFFFESTVLFVAFGYLWKPYVGAGLTSSLIRTIPGTPDIALTGLLWMLGGIGALITWSRCWVARYQEGQGKEAGSPFWAATPFLTMLGVYAAGCLLAGRNPFPPSALEMAGKLAVITAGGGIMARMAASACLTPLTLGLFPLVAIVSPSTVMITVASPFAGLLCQSDHIGRITNTLFGYTFIAPPWWMFALVPALLGVLARGKARAKVPERMPSEPRIAPLELPTHEPRKRKFTLKRDTPIAVSTVGWLQDRWDNAVMVKELRVKLRGRLGKAEIAAFVALFYLPLILCFVYPDVLPASVTWITEGLFGDRVAAGSNLVGASISVVAFMLAVIMSFVGALTAAAAFARERDRSTLVFLLMTPMPTARIVLGKLVGILLPAIMALLAAAACNAIPALVLVLTVGPGPAIEGWLIATIVPFLLLLWGGALGLISASLLKKEADATGVAVLGMFLSAWLFGFLYAIAYETVFSPFTNPVQDPRTIAIIFAVSVAIFTSVLLTASLAFACWRVGRWRLTEGERAG